MHIPRFQLDRIDLGCLGEDAGSDQLDVLRDYFPLTGGLELANSTEFPLISATQAQKLGISGTLDVVG
jgi:hypothetical protein